MKINKTDDGFEGQIISESRRKSVSLSVHKTRRISELRLESFMVLRQVILLNIIYYASQIVPSIIPFYLSSLKLMHDERIIYV